MKVAALTTLSVAQLAAASWSIARYESTLRSGSPYRIRAAAFDPADAFRGRYVAVQPVIRIARPIATETERRLQRISSFETGYVVLTTDADGFAAAAQILSEPPSAGDYLEIARVWQWWDRETTPSTEATLAGYNLVFSFDRYYMAESDAPAAQQRYADATRQDRETNAWLAVRVKDGVGVIEGLYIDGVPIEKIVAAPAK
jgi:uncharacterized membrane-anchored protein